MAISPVTILKLMNEKKQFEKRHPRVVSFVNQHLLSPLPEGTVLEISITRPGSAPVTTNMKITAEDQALFEELKELK